MVIIGNYLEDDSWYLLHFGQFPTCVLIVAQIFLVSDQDDGNVGTEVLDLWGPLLWNVFCEAKGQKLIYKAKLAQDSFAVHGNEVVKM